MQQSAGNILQKITLQLLVYSFSAMHSQNIGFLNQRADNISLPSCLHLTHQAGVNLTAALIRITQRPHRLTLRRTSLHYGNIQIAVNSKRQGTRNRRCRHYQYIGSILRFIRQACTLLYAEAVLLVRHRQRQIGKAHILLQKCMRTHNYINKAQLQIQQQLTPCLGTHTACQ